MWVTIGSGEGSGLSVRVEGERFLIGSGEECQLMVRGERIDPLHAYFEVHDDGNVSLHDLGSEAGTAVSRSYFTALQAVSDLALQPIVSGRYHDRFERRDGQWRFVERRVRTDLVGDVSRHLRHGAAGR